MKKSLLATLLLVSSFTYAFAIGSECYDFNYNMAEYGSIDGQYFDTDQETMNEISKLQKFLREEGSLVSGVSIVGSARYGVLTKNAVISFQAKHLEFAPGVVGPTTRRLIKALTCNPTAVAPTNIDFVVTPLTVELNKNMTWTWVANNNPTSYRYGINSNDSRLPDLVQSGVGTPDSQGKFTWTTTPSILGAIVGKSYVVSMQGCNSVGCSPVKSQTVQIINDTASLNSDTPIIPRITSISPGNGQVTINFTAGNSAATSEPNNPVTKYGLVCTSNNQVPTYVNASVSPLSATITGLPNGTPTTCQVVIVNASGQTIQSSSAPSSTSVTPSATSASTACRLYGSSYYFSSNSTESASCEALGSIIFGGNGEDTLVIARSGSYTLDQNVDIVDLGSYSSASFTVMQSGNRIILSSNRTLAITVTSAVQSDSNGTVFKFDNGQILSARINGSVITFGSQALTSNPLLVVPAPICHSEQNLVNGRCENITIPYVCPDGTTVRVPGNAPSTSHPGYCTSAGSATISSVLVNTSLKTITVRGSNLGNVNSLKYYTRAQDDSTARGILLDVEQIVLQGPTQIVFSYGPITTRLLRGTTNVWDVSLFTASGLATTYAWTRGVAITDSVVVTDTTVPDGTVTGGGVITSPVTPVTTCLPMNYKYNCETAKSQGYNALKISNGNIINITKIIECSDDAYYYADMYYSTNGSAYKGGYTPNDQVCKVTGGTATPVITTPAVQEVYPPEIRIFELDRSTIPFEESVTLKYQLSDFNSASNQMSCNIYVKNLSTGSSGSLPPGTIYGSKSDTVEFSGRNYPAGAEIKAECINSKGAAYKAVKTVSFTVDRSLPLKTYVWRIVTGPGAGSSVGKSGVSLFLATKLCREETLKATASQTISCSWGTDDITGGASASAPAVAPSTAGNGTTGSSQAKIFTVIASGSGKIALDTPGMATVYVNKGQSITSYPVGTVLTVKAIPDAGSTFTWAGSGCNSQSSTCTITLGTDNNVSATFSSNAVLAPTNTDFVISPLTVELNKNMTWTWIANNNPSSYRYGINNYSSTLPNVASVGTRDSQGKYTWITTPSTLGAVAGTSYVISMQGCNSSGCSPARNQIVQVVNDAPVAPVNNSPGTLNLIFSINGTRISQGQNFNVNGVSDVVSWSASGAKACYMNGSDVGSVLGVSTIPGLTTSSHRFECVDANNSSTVLTFSIYK